MAAAHAWSASRPRSLESLEGDCGVASTTAGLKRGGTTEFLKAKRRKMKWAPPASSLSSLQCWPSVYVEKLAGEQALFANLLDKVTTGVQLDSDYTGSGCMEQAATLIRDELCVAHIDVEFMEESWLSAHRACDVDARCQALLQEQSDHGVKPLHIFGDLCERLNMQTRTQLEEISGKWASLRAEMCEWFPNLAVEHHAISRMVGEAMTREMMKFMEHRGAEQIAHDLCGWCFRHNKRCPLFRPPSADVEEVVALAAVDKGCAPSVFVACACWTDEPLLGDSLK